MCYYGHAENTSNLGGDVAWSFFFGALVEIPAYSVPFLINRDAIQHFSWFIEGFSRHS